MSINDIIALAADIKALLIAAGAVYFIAWVAGKAVKNATKERRK